LVFSLPKRYGKTVLPAQKVTKIFHLSHLGDYYSNLRKKVKLLMHLQKILQFMTIFCFDFYVNCKLDIGRIFDFHHDIWCRKVTKNYISCRVMRNSCNFGCIGIMDKSAALFGRTFPLLTEGFLWLSH